MRKVKKSRAALAAASLPGLRVGEDQRLVVPAEPEVGVEIFGIELVVEFADDFVRIAERTEEGDLRDAPSGAAGFVEYFEQGPPDCG